MDAKMNQIMLEKRYKIGHHPEYKTLKTINPVITQTHARIL